MSDPLVDEIAARLPERAGRRLPIDDLMRDLVDLRPELGTASDRYVRLAEIVGVLTQRDLVIPSKGRIIRQGVVLPRSVVVAGGRDTARPADNPARRFPWVVEMAWAADGPRRPPDVHRRLTLLSEWIAAHPHPRPVPVRERSLEVFGDDKVLERMLDGMLRTRAETDAALAVERVHPPMAVAEIEGAAGRRVLVVENGTTFHSVVRAARGHAATGAPVAIRWVGYGAGEQLSAILPSLGALAPEAISYFGDLDPEGLRFAATGARRGSEAGLPELTPARVLYGRLLDRGRPQRKKAPASWPAAGLEWLGPDLAARLRGQLGDGVWLAQEWVGLEVLEADSTWCTGE
jgi:hypothetical protein